MAMLNPVLNKCWMINPIIDQTRGTQELRMQDVLYKKYVHVQVGVLEPPSIQSKTYKK